MIDFHSHILHGVDDGAKDENMTIEMLKLAEKSGTREIVATPHFFRGRFQTPYGEIKKEVAKLKTLAKENHINIEIHFGNIFSKNYEEIEEDEIYEEIKKYYDIIKHYFKKYNK